ncbi:outer membrane protein TolC [Sporomusaceae bacterium BoRhaA]|uniref:TolC family protein n=1 Tax=Pelorhabdus rhamnosifermentans TaxID=2772457 RepID=UPI001C0615E1|nr:TolC family protein [Pelorhabdus rhamnosifermentans]MBU2703578.1 outer membrane protein TolC [Pelorhabdus rhamnosifermentans]
MNRYQQYFAVFILMVASMTLHQVVLAAPLELSLEDSISLALKNNHDIQYAKSAREKSYWALQQAKNNKGVSVTYTHNDERYNTPPSSYSPNYSYTTEFDNQVALTLPVYSGKKLENQIAQAKIDLDVADLDVDVAKQQLKMNVISDYLTVMEYDKEVQVDQETVANYEDHLNLVQKKFDLGLVAKTDILSSQVNLASAQDTLIKAQNNYNNAVATLNNAIGMPHGTELKLNEKFGYKKYDLTLEQCIQYAAIHRPEIAQYDAKIKSAQYDVKIAKSGYSPTVNLTAEEDWYNDHLPGMKNNNWLVKLTTSLNVFDSGLTDTKVRQAEHNVNMVTDKAATERDSILLAVRQYYLSMKEAEKRIETNKVSVNQAQENLTIEQAKYDVGMGTNLDLLDDVLSLNTAKKNYVQAFYDYNTNQAELEQAMGMPVK